MSEIQTKHESIIDINPKSNPKITTKFSWSNSHSNQSSFNQPLFLIGSFLKEQTLKVYNHVRDNYSRTKVLNIYKDSLKYIS